MKLLVKLNGEWSMVVAPDLIEESAVYLMAGVPVKWVKK